MTETFVKERPLQAATSGDEGLTAKASSEMGEVTVDDAAAFMTRFQNGAMGVFEATRFAPGRRNFNTFEINGEKGSISFNFERMNELEYFNAEDPTDRQGFRTINVNENDQPYAAFTGPPVILSVTNTPSSTRFTTCCRATPGASRRIRRFAMAPIIIWFWRRLRNRKRRRSGKIFRAFNFSQRAQRLHKGHKEKSVRSNPFGAESIAPISNADKAVWHW